MNFQKLPVFILTVSVLNCINSVKAQTKTLRPENEKDKLALFESGKSQTYYKLLQADPSILLIKGPGKLQVLTRILINNDNKLSGYNIFYSIDGGSYNKLRYSRIESSDKVKNLSNVPGVPSSINMNEIEFSPGDHSLEVKAEKDAPVVVARFIFNKIKEKKVKWVMLSPISPNDPVDLVTKENIIHYYRFSEKKPLKIRINGPTTLRVLTRFENHFNMKGRIDYRIQLKEDGKLARTYLLSSIFSEVTTYKKDLKLIPGKAREFYIQVPPGKHIYTLTPMDKDKNTILARVLFPKKDVKLEE